MFNKENIENEFFKRLSFHMTPEQLGIGKILISEPFMSDPNFSRTVVLLVQYSVTEGAVGLVLNKPTDIDITDVANPFPVEGHQLYYGGPVSPQNMLFLHTEPTVEGADKIVEGLYWGGDFEVVKEHLALGKIGLDNIKFFGGYSGWSSGQLESELEQNAWIISDLDDINIFKEDPLELWKKILKDLGSHYSIMANFPENPQLN